MLYVGNLSFRATEDDVRSLFEEFGYVSSCALIMDVDTGGSKGYAFVEMPRKSESDAAIHSLDNREFMGRRLAVREMRFSSTEATAPLSPIHTAEFDIFICHASEDKKEFVEPLARELRERGLRVWYDSFTLKLGDRLRSAIDKGLSFSRFGVVVLSPSFCRKDWPKRELEGLLALERDGHKVILPLWHGVTVEDVTRFSPMLADRVALSSETPIGDIVDEILDVVRG